MALLLFWPALVLALARLQGPLLPALRRTPPGDEATAQSRALHGWGSLAYYLPVLLVPAGLPGWVWLGTAAMARLVLFDVLLNQAAGDPLFHVGSTAATDRLLRRLSRSPDRLNAAVKATGLLAYAGAVLLLR